MTIATGDIFQPVPYSAATPQGMPSDIEEKYFLKEEVSGNVNYRAAHAPLLRPAPRPRVCQMASIVSLVSYRNDNRFRADGGLLTRCPIINTLFIRSNRIASLSDSDPTNDMRGVNTEIQVMVLPKGSAFFGSDLSRPNRGGQYIDIPYPLAVRRSYRISRGLFSPI